MRKDIHAILQAKNIDFFSLPLCARLLLVTDGTVTELLEAMLCEPLQLSYKEQDRKTNEDLTIKRRVVLSGQYSQIPWLYAESFLFTQALPFSIQQKLATEDLPIGSIFQHLKSDTHREIIDCGYAQNTLAAQKLHIADDYMFLYRRYYIVSQQAHLMEICEWFPFHRIHAKMDGQF